MTLNEATVEAISKRKTRVGETPIKAKAALLWSAASLLLPRMVDELFSSIARAPSNVKRSSGSG
jgi:hypothetical protein